MALPKRSVRITYLARCLLWGAASDVRGPRRVTRYDIYGHTADVLTENAYLNMVAFLGFCFTNNQQLISNTGRLWNSFVLNSIV